MVELDGATHVEELGSVVDGGHAGKGLDAPHLATFEGGHDLRLPRPPVVAVHVESTGPGPVLQPTCIQPLRPGPRGVRGGAGAGELRRRRLGTNHDEGLVARGLEALHGLEDLAHSGGDAREARHARRGLYEVPDGAAEVHELRAHAHKIAHHIAHGRGLALQLEGLKRPSEHGRRVLDEVVVHDAEHPLRPGQAQRGGEEAAHGAVQERALSLGPAEERDLLRARPEAAVGAPVVPRECRLHLRQAFDNREHGGLELAHRETHGDDRRRRVDAQLAAELHRQQNNVEQRLGHGGEQRRHLAGEAFHVSGDALVHLVYLAARKRRRLEEVAPADVGLVHGLRQAPLEEQGLHASEVLDPGIDQGSRHPERRVPQHGPLHRDPVLLRHGFGDAPSHLGCRHGEECPRRRATEECGRARRLHSTALALQEADAQQAEEFVPHAERPGEAPGPDGKEGDDQKR